MVQTEYTYEPFGTPSASGTGSANPTRFTGREWDGTGLQYNRARYYNPTISRFISEDPLGFGGGDTNVYAYVRNAPQDATDPLGENPILIIGGRGPIFRIPGTRAPGTGRPDLNPYPPPSPLDHLRGGRIGRAARDSYRNWRSSPQNKWGSRRCSKMLCHNKSGQSPDYTAPAYPDDPCIDKVTGYQFCKPLGDPRA